MGLLLNLLPSQASVCILLRHDTFSRASCCYLLVHRRVAIATTLKLVTKRPVVIATVEGGAVGLLLGVWRHVHPVVARRLCARKLSFRDADWLAGYELLAVQEASFAVVNLHAVCVKAEFLDAHFIVSWS